MCLFLHVSVSISMFASDSGFISVHVYFGPFHVSVCDCVLWECMFVCVPECLYPRAPMFVFVFVHDWVPLLERGFLYVGLPITPASLCFSCVSSPASPIASACPLCLSLPILTACLYLSLYLPLLCLCVSIPGVSKLARELRMVYIFLMIEKNNIS